MLLIKMAFRNILRNKRRTFLTGTLMVFGFVLVSISLGLVDGSYGAIIEAFTRQSTGHVQIVNSQFIENKSINRKITNYESLLLRLKSHTDVNFLTTRSYSNALIYANKQTYGAEVVGIDPKLEDLATGISKRVYMGEFIRDDLESQSILVGKKIANYLRLELGQEIILISQGADGSIANDLFTVRGFIGTENGDDTFRIYMGQKLFSEFYTLHNSIHEISVHLKDIKKARTFAHELQLPTPLMARPWQEVQKDFYRAMEMDKNGNTFTLFIIMFIVGLTILNTVLMSTLERVREFGVLKAMGTRPSVVFKLILMEGVILAMMSSFIGMVLAIGINYYLSVVGIELSEPISFAGILFSQYKSELSFNSILSPYIVVILTTIIACLYPGIKSSRIRVTNALREY